MTNTQASCVASVFDPATYPRAERPGHCFGCGRGLRSVTGLHSYRRRFREVTGRKWPGAISLNMHRPLDFRSCPPSAAELLAPERRQLVSVCAWE
jgi:hypothetical protein